MQNLWNAKFDEFRLTLALTFACNLACTYCYVEPQSKVVMTKAIAESGIKLALEKLNPPGILNIGFFGGEPLLKADLLVWILQRARELAAPEQIEVRSFLTTNGTVLTDSLVETLKKEGVEITVSIDGTMESHNKFRQGPDGSGSYRMALDGLKLAATKLNNCGVNMVIQPETVKSTATGFKELAEIVNRFDLSIDYAASWDLNALEELERQYTEIGEYFIKKTKQGSPLSVSFIEGKLIAIANGGLPHKCRCAPGTDELTISPSGELIACERQLTDRENNSGKAAYLGEVTEGVMDDRLTNLQKLCDSLPESCDSCDISAFCVNDCMCNNMCRTGEPSSPDGMICFTEKLALKVASNVLSGLGKLEG